MSELRNHPRKLTPNSATFTRTGQRLRRRRRRRQQQPGDHPPSALSRPVEDCDGYPALAGTRNSALDDPSAGRPDWHCNFGDRSIRACRAAASTQQVPHAGRTGGTVRHPPRPAIR